MVFENLTLFEIQLDGAQFGPRSMVHRDGDSADEHTVDEAEPVASSGRGRLLPVFMLAALAIGAAALWRSSRSSEFELDAESEDAEADLATAQ